MDYRSIGYRECIGETISYLVHGEGLGPTNLLHTRLISHLHQQLSVYDQTAQTSSQYGGTSAPVENPLSMYPAVCPASSYESAGVCKPEPSTSPSYCGTSTVPAAEFHNYPLYTSDCLRSSVSTSTDSANQWQVPASCPTDSSNSRFCNFAPQSSWVWARVVFFFMYIVIN